MDMVHPSPHSFWSARIGVLSPSTPGRYPYSTPLASESPQLQHKKPGYHAVGRNRHSYQYYVSTLSSPSPLSQALVPSGRLGKPIAKSRGAANKQSGD
ncbi:uncharacterized protein TrAtP1_006783 [Trichoderma atroviride]|uniref:Uncharacterized protein n=1 Tax=Hypocrea atroviridis (strain ATCC 20476 / IMI 206040) TaxID=452589 RepID=G9PBF8_HYPAI|nr:uncharacterized protein TRIATDRAFT_160157 [Trichoderma atroviride IMI 206040]EHK39703.1 hypothetical protein TRIATDRAFT_160157 [Trichoderma atroviride IMI 206040]UKZ65585.1 hypothetical protein TrAtP1_006783 [Trichoderma atroviride]